jgi:hypothetical protein
MTEAYFLYIYLELAQRYKVKNYQETDSDIGDTILKHKTDMQNIFREKWAVYHRCSVPGCGWCITIDGGLKPHRMLCGAKLSGIRIFPKAGTQIFTGCTRHPGPKSKYCPEHEKEESPVIHADKLSSRSKQALRNHRSSTKSFEDVAQDDFFIVESILQFKKAEVKVKWVGFPEPTWEPQEGIPGFLR